MTKNNKFAICVVGGGLAGIICALTLRALDEEVIVLDGGEGKEKKPGEALSIHVLPLLSKLNLEHVLECIHAIPITEILSRWNSVDKHLPWKGFLIDRATFENQLAKIAIDRGVAWYKGTKLKRQTWMHDRWHIVVEKDGKLFDIYAKQLVDASGRSAIVSRLQGKRHINFSPQVASWALVKSKKYLKPHIQVIRNKNDWWYVACYEDIKSVMVFDTKPPKLEKDWKWFALQRNIIENDEELLTPITQHAAYNRLLSQPFGIGWIAVGDAAASFDPITGYGMTFAMGSGYYGACAIHSKQIDELRTKQYYADFIFQKAQTVQLHTLDIYLN